MTSSYSQRGVMMLTDFNRPRGSVSALLDNGKEVSDAIRYVTPEMFEDMVVSGDWAPVLPRLMTASKLT